MPTPTSRGQHRGAPGDLPGYASGSDERGRRDRHIGQSADPLNAGQPAVSARLHTPVDAASLVVGRPRTGSRTYIALQLSARPEGVTSLQLSVVLACTVQHACEALQRVIRDCGIPLQRIHTEPAAGQRGRPEIRFRLPDELLAHPTIAEVLAGFEGARRPDFAISRNRPVQAEPVAAPAALPPAATVIPRPLDRYELDPSAPLRGAGFAALAIGSYPAPLRPWTERTS
jgi:hypothetical protein